MKNVICAALILTLSACDTVRETLKEDVEFCPTPSAASGSSLGDFCWQLDGWTPYSTSFSIANISSTPCHRGNIDMVWMKALNDGADSTHWVLIPKDDPMIDQTGPTDWQANLDLWASNEVVNSNQVTSVNIRQDVFCGVTGNVQTACPVPTNFGPGSSSSCLMDPVKTPNPNGPFDIVQ